MRQTRGHIERSAAEVIDRQAIVPALAFLAIAMGELERRGGRFIEQAKHVKATNPRRIFGEETLVAVSVRGNT